jgi:hypothetical protein
MANYYDPMCAWERNFGESPSDFVAASGAKTADDLAGAVTEALYGFCDLEGDEMEMCLAVAREAFDRIAEEKAVKATVMKPFGMLWPWKDEPITLLHRGKGRILAKTRNRDVIVDGVWNGETLTVRAQIGSYEMRGFVDDLRALLAALEDYEKTTAHDPCGGRRCDECEIACDASFDSEQERDAPVSR